MLGMVPHTPGGLGPGLPIVNCAGALTVAGVLAKQPLASFAVTVYGPAASPLNVPEAWKVTPSSEKVLAPVPPLAVALMLPGPPKQFGLVTGALTVNCAGALTVAGVLAKQPLASFAVTVYGPAASPLNVPEAWKVTPSSEKVLAPVPPLAVALMLPVPPKQFGLVTGALTVNCAGALTVAGVLAKQPLASFAVTVYGPAASPLNVPEAWKVTPSSEKVLAPVPPKQFGLVTGALTVNCAGALTVAGVLAKQPLASFAVTVYGPAASPLNVPLSLHDALPI